MSAGSIPPAPRDGRRLYWIVMVGIGLYAVLDVVAQLLPPHYSPVTQAESDLAVGPYGYVMTVNFVNRGVLSLVFLYALVRTVRSEARGWRPFRSGVAFLSLWALGSVVLAVFPTDVPSLPLTAHGAVHLVVALLAFFGGAVGVFALADHFGESEILRPAKRYGMGLSIVVLILFVLELGLGFVAPRFGASVAGLTERLFLGSVLGWIFLVSWYLARPPEPRSPPAAGTAPTGTSAAPPNEGSGGGIGSPEAGP